MEAGKRAPTLQSAGAFMARWGDWLLGLGVLGLMVTLLTPMPPAALDVLLAVNITASLLMLLVTMNVKSSHELSTFPTVLPKSSWTDSRWRQPTITILPMDCVGVLTAGCMDDVVILVPANLAHPARRTINGFQSTVASGDITPSVKRSRS